MSESKSSLHGKWSQPEVPHKGWTCVDIEPLETASATCGMCETQQIRFVHYMTHPDYSGELGCGCVCAGRMEEDYVGAERREALAKSTIGKRKRWLTRAWKTSMAGRPYLKIDGYHVVIFKNDALVGGKPTWGFKVTSDGGSHTTSRAPHPSINDAKLKAFDALTLMRIAKKNWMQR